LPYIQTAIAKLAAMAISNSQILLLLPQPAWLQFEPFVTRPGTIEKMTDRKYFCKNSGSVSIGPMWISGLPTSQSLRAILPTAFDFLRTEFVGQ
jgi:hypothetical protein